MVPHRLGNVVMLDQYPVSWIRDEIPSAYLELNGIHNWALSLGADHPLLWKMTPQLLQKYDVVFANCEPKWIGHLCMLQDQTRRTTKWITLIESDISGYTSPSAGLLKLLRNSTLIININKLTTPFLSAISNVPVLDIGIPYPSLEVGNRYKRPDKVKMEALCTLKEDFAPSLAAATLAGVPCTAFVSKASRKLANLPLFIRSRSTSKFLYAEEYGRTYQNRALTFTLRLESICEFLDYARHFRAWIHLDPRHTWARGVLDGAALGIPVVSCANTVHAELLFPDITVESPYDSVAAASHLRRLMDDQEFANEVGLKAQERIRDLYTAEACVGSVELALQATFS